MIRKSKTVYLENYTNPNISILNALYKITILYYVLHFLVLIRWLVTFIFGVGELRQWIVILDGFAFFFCTCWYLFVALNKPEFFRGVNAQLKPIVELIPKQKPSPAIDDQKNKQILALKEFMIEKFADDYFEPSYFTDVLKIDPEKIAAFQYYCVEDSRFMKAVEAKNKTQATFWINDLAVQYNLLQKADLFEK